MFYLPRLYVYHADAKPGSELSETFKVMERRLLRVIINPAMLLVWITGPLLAWLEGVYMEPWFHAKVALVLVMSGLHGALSRWRRDFAEDRNTRSARFFRIANEVPPLLMVLIVILVILKPF
jgi:putative membrane protein